MTVITDFESDPGVHLLVGCDARLLFTHGECLNATLAYLKEHAPNFTEVYTAPGENGTASTVAVHLGMDPLRFPFHLALGVGIDREETHLAMNHMSIREKRLHGIKELTTVLRTFVENSAGCLLIVEPYMFGRLLRLLKIPETSVDVKTGCLYRATLKGGKIDSIKQLVR